MNFRRSIPLSAVALFLTVAPCLAGPCAKEIAETQAAFDAKLDAAAASGPTAPEFDLRDAAPPAHTLHGRARRSSTRRHFAGKCGDRHPCARTSTRRGPDWGCPGLPRATRRGQGSVAQVGRRHESQTATEPPPRLRGCDCWAGRSQCNRGGPRRCNSGSRAGDLVKRHVDPAAHLQSVVVRIAVFRHGRGALQTSRRTYNGIVTFASLTCQRHDALTDRKINRLGSAREEPNASEIRYSWPT